MRKSRQWLTFFKLLVNFNQGWARNAACLVVIISKNTFDYSGKKSRTHSFDTGAAWQNMALQGSSMGLVVHGMEGFDYDLARRLLKVPNDHTVEAMVAVGRKTRKIVLSADLQKKEFPRIYAINH